MKTALITGGSSGLGKALTFELARHGIKVFIIGQNEERLIETGLAFPDLIVHIKADISKESERQNIFCILRKEGVKLDYFIHNAGTEKPFKLFEEITLEEWQYAFSLNVEAVFSLTKGLLFLLQPLFSRILIISSGLAYKPLQGLSTYCSSKAALSMLAECLKIELKPKGIGVAIGLPGAIDTEMQCRLRDREKTSGTIGNFFHDLKSSDKIRSPEIVADFFRHILVRTDPNSYTDTLWDINKSEELSRKFLVGDFL